MGLRRTHGSLLQATGSGPSRGRVVGMRIAALVLVLVACGREPPYWTCDGTETACLDGTPVFVDPSMLPTYGTPSMMYRVAVELDASLAYWSVPAVDLAGWRIRYVAADTVPCNAEASGCWDEGDRTISLTFARTTGCIESSPLPHEIGHFIDRGHTDPRWCDFAQLLELLWTQPSCGAMSPIGWPLPCPLPTTR